MGSSIAVIRYIGFWVVALSTVFGLYLRHLAAAGALAAAAAGTEAASTILPHDWDCTETGPDFARAAAAAARSVVARTDRLASVSPVAMTLTADRDCLLATSVTTSAAGSWSALDVTAVTCAPVTATAALGWDVTGGCRP